MTKFTISNMKPSHHAGSTLATFNVHLRELGISLRGITLSRPSHVPVPETRLYFPDQRKVSDTAYYIGPCELRTRIGAAACAAYTAMTGEPASFIPKEAIDDSTEDEAAGMMRFIGAENETLRKAGI
ncbi:hypothetical protein [Shinella sp. DD12]|uniref:hypothetical protein n=1 Tax=Shinella sp. DD12 TaxID=1410620 RepID=UPI0004379B8B|nr:hypothetical protein [Shinella sp. DD12]EYR81866.1 hypothetical protein SHLA_4c001580 [Shinella sp. DD12]